MSSLLDFQHELLTKSKNAVYSIETGELNPKELEAEEITNTQETTELSEYGLKTIREYIYRHSSTLSESGNIISGEVKKNQIILTVLKRK